MRRASPGGGSGASYRWDIVDFARGRLLRSHRRPRLFLLSASLLTCRGKSKRREPLAKITFPVEASHIMMFARAVGDDNPVYHDAAAAKDTGAGGIIAPPSFAQAVAQF